MTDTVSSSGLAAATEFSRPNTGTYVACCDCAGRIYRRPGVGSSKKRCDECAEARRAHVRLKSIQKRRAENRDAGHVAALCEPGATNPAINDTSQRVANAGARGGNMDSGVARPR